MKKSILLMLVAFIVISCSSGLKQKSNYDSPYSIEFTQPEELQAMEEGRSGFGYCTDGKYLYAINGYTVTNTLFFADALRYDIENDKWTQFTDKLIRKRYCSAEYLNGKIFVFNGIESNGINNAHTEVLDVKTGEINVFKGNPNPVTIGGSAQWQGKIYVYGGGIYETRNAPLPIYNSHPFCGCILREVNVKQKYRVPDNPMDSALAKYTKAEQLNILRGLKYTNPLTVGDVF